MRVDGSEPIQASSRNNVSQSKGNRAIANKEIKLLEEAEETEIFLSEEEIAYHLEKVNDTMRTFDKGLNFELHEDSGRYMVQVMDLVEEEIIREIPPEEVLNISARINEMIGLVLDVRI